MIKLILLDLDGTLLRSDKTISDRTVQVLHRCQKQGMLVAYITARGESNAQSYIQRVQPDLVISSGGALVRYRGEIIRACLLSPDETQTLISAGFRETNHACEITIDTLDGHYWNYKEDPNKTVQDWGEVHYTDYSDWAEASLKVSVQITDPEAAARIAASIEDCDHIAFSDIPWYKFTKNTATKERAIHLIEDYFNITSDEMIAFGDDYGDIEMLKYCGTGVAMANAIEPVKEAANAITKDNDHDGVAVYLENILTRID